MSARSIHALRAGLSRIALPRLLICGMASIAGAASSAESAATPSLQIYFIDVEGGQSTLVVTPEEHSLLIDTGWAGAGTGYQPGDPAKARDANRIAAAARDAGIRQIDYLLITHFHTDHDGGVQELSRLMPIQAFIDHEVPSTDAQSTSAETRNAFVAYQAVRDGHRHLVPKPGERLPLRDIDAIVVSSAGATLQRPLPGAGDQNSACTAQATAPRDVDENPRSTGVVIRFGKFRFLDVGDLTGGPLYNLVCPTDLIGPVDAYLVAHHGGPDVMISETFGALRPKVAILNNGWTKGGAPETFQALHRVIGLQDAWQLHTSASSKDSNFALERIANPDESTSYWLKLVASPDGSFRLYNQRTGQWKSYSSKAP